jgi:hypothetical protein
MTEGYPANYKKLEPAKITRWLARIDREAVMSPDLKQAVEEALKAMKAKDYDLAEQTTAVKSFIVSSRANRPYSEMDALNGGNHFWEDGAANEAKFGDDLYGILDAMTHELSFYMMKRGIDTVPAGAMEISARGIKERALPGTNSSPTLRLMRQEHDRIVEESKELWKKE